MASNDWHWPLEPRLAAKVAMGAGRLGGELMNAWRSPTNGLFDGRSVRLHFPVAHPLIRGVEIGASSTQCRCFGALRPCAGGLSRHLSVLTNCRGVARLRWHRQPDEWHDPAIDAVRKKPELPTASVGTSQAPTAAVDNSAGCMPQGA